MIRVASPALQTWDASAPHTPKIPTTMVLICRIKLMTCECGPAGEGAALDMTFAARLRRCL